MQGFYSVMLRLYPRAFQQRFRDETLSVFRDDCLATYQVGGRLAVVALWLRSLPDVLGCAVGEHLAEWMSDHPAQRRSARHQATITLLLALAVVTVFLVDENTPPETPMAIMYACVLFAAGSLLPPGLAALIGTATLGVYVVDGWISPSGWTAYRLLGLVALLTAGVWALRTGADHARLRARAGVSSASEAFMTGALGSQVPAPYPAGLQPEPSTEVAVQLLRSLLARAPQLASDELIAVLTDGIAVLEGRDGEGNRAD
jgi:hypothetical protein